MGSAEKKQTFSGIFLFLVAAYIACLLISNLIAGKMWAIGNIALPAAVILFPITYILGDVFTEVYGFQKARLAIWLGFGCSFFAVLIYFVTLILPHPDFWQGQEAFETVFSTTPRVALASFVGYLFGEFSNSIILSKLKVKTGGKHLWMRTILSTLVGEGFDSVIFIMISFWGTMEPTTIFRMILFQYLFKVAYEVLFTPVTYAVVRGLKKKEKIDTFDANIRYRVL